MGCESSISKEILGKSLKKDKVEVEAAVKMAMGKISYLDPNTNIELHFSCKDLPNIGIIDSTIDTFIVMYLNSNRAKEEWEKVGETEVIHNNLNPKFTTSINCKYLFEEKQFAKVEIYNQKTKRRNKSL